MFEFSRLNLSNNILSKRKIKEMIEKKYVSGWDDPRLLTLNGLKNRGVTPNSINNFISKISIAR